MTILSSSSVKNIPFYLPKKNVLEPNSSDDPFFYYYHPLVGFLYRARIKQALSLLNTSYDSILELGFGSGILIPSLSLRGRNISGIDIGSDPLKVKRNLEKIGIQASLIRGDICNSNYPNESFDLVVAISIVEHIRNIEDLIKKVFYILRPGGHFLVGMPAVNKFMEITFFMIGFRNIKAHHVTDYKQFLELTNRFFKLDKIKKIPPWTSKSTSLYLNMLFSKR